MIATVQHEQFGQYTKSIRIYVCATPDSFEDMTGRTVKAMTYRDSIFLSPRLMEHPDTIAPYLTHELSHLIMLHHMGLYRFMTTPPWFKEGLAVHVSKGGGAVDVTEQEAAHVIVSGKSFKPHGAGGILDLFFPKYGSHWKLKPHMFYRQSSLFVVFMKEYNQEAFENMLATMQQGERFDISFQQAYDMSTMDMWHLFVNQLESDIDKKPVIN